MHTKLSSASTFLFLLVLTAGYQFLYCHLLPDGDLTSLFFSGALRTHPPELERSGYRYQNSTGYDGQMYRTLAHDPLSRKGYWKYLDDPRLRARRILIPAMAGLLGGSSISAVDFWYVAVTDILMALGGLWFVRLAERCCSRLAAVILYSLIPAIIASTDRMVLDGPAVAGFLAVWLFLRERRMTLLFAVLALLPLIRETGLLITVGAGIVFFRSREYRRLALAAMTTIPALLWWSFVAAHTPASGAGSLLSVPLVPQIVRLFTPVSRPVPQLVNTLLQAVDVVADTCLLLAFALLAHTIWRELRHGRLADDTLLIIPVAVLAAFASGPEILKDPYAFLRVDSALIAWAALRMLTIRPLFAAAYLSASGAALLIFRGRLFIRF